VCVPLLLPLSNTLVSPDTTASLGGAGASITGDGGSILPACFGAGDAIASITAGAIFADATTSAMRDITAAASSAHGANNGTGTSSDSGCDCSSSSGSDSSSGSGSASGSSSAAPNSGSWCTAAAAAATIDAASAAAAAAAAIALAALAAASSRRCPRHTKNLYCVAQSRIG
jgi:hypothetical protein